MSASNSGASNFSTDPWGDAGRKMQPTSWWERAGLWLSCLAGNTSEQLGAIPTPQDSTDNPGRTAGQRQLPGPNKKGRKVPYNASGPEKGNGADAMAGGAAYGSGVFDCLAFVSTIPKKK